MQKEALEWIGKNFVMIVLVGSIFIQITPIKINPWSSLFQWMGKMITNNACSKLDGVIKQIDQIDKNVDENEKDRIRWEILSFANSCRIGRKHTYDEFKHIADLNDKYEKLLAKTEDKNGIFKMEYEYIQKIFHKRQERNDFLTTEGDE